MIVQPSIDKYGSHYKRKWKKQLEKKIISI